MQTLYLCVEKSPRNQPETQSAQRNPNPIQTPSEYWTELRRQWEYSHATSAGLNLMALVAVILSVLAQDEPK